MQDIISFLSMKVQSDVEAELIFAPEGIYVLSVYDIKKGILKTRFDHSRNYSAIINEAYDKYKNIKTEEEFYNLVIQDFKYAKKLDKLIKKYNLQLSYFPKEKTENNKWIYGKIYLPIMN